MKYAALHCHSMYSYLDGVGNIQHWIAAAKAKELAALAITDHGYMAGCAELHHYGKKEGMPIIFGCEMYIHTVLSQDRNDKYRHITVIAKDKTGFKNLCKLQYLSFRNDHFYYKPRITYDELFAHKDGLIIGSACMSGFIAQDLLDWFLGGAADKNLENAWRSRIEEFKYHFADDLYLEVMCHPHCKEWDGPTNSFIHAPHDKQELLNAACKYLAQRYNVKVIATPDAHMVDTHEKLVQDCMLGTRYLSHKAKDSVDAEALGWRFDQTYYLPTATEMQTMFLSNFKDKHTVDEVNSYITNTLEVADKCKPINFATQVYLPSPPESIGNNALYDMIVERGRINLNDIVYAERLRYELDILTKNGTIDLTGYFILLADVVDWARANDVVVGVGRGSAGGCLVAYALGIISIDPIKWNLPFERFINLARIQKGTLPDIDLDFSDQEPVFNYLKEKYGEAHVCGITANQTYKFKLALKDTYRGLARRSVGANLEAICKLVGDDESKEALQAWNANPQVQSWIASGEAGENVNFGDRPVVTPELRKDIIRVAMAMSGQVRHPGVHAAAVIVSPVPIYEVVPMSTAGGVGKKERKWVTQYSMKWVEAAGLVKFDLLGLSTLRDIGQCLEFIKSDHGISINKDDIPEDPSVFEVFEHPELLDAAMTSVFQFDTDVAKPYLKDLRPRSILDLAVITALARPGAMDSKQDEIFKERWKERRRNPHSVIDYPHPALEAALKDTLGVMVFQEQVMSAVQILGGFTAPEADDIRRGMGKKQAELLDAAKQRFIDHAVAKYQDIDNQKADKLWNDIDSFARYGFNAAHAVAYGYTAYQCLYLKHHYPLQWWAAVLTNETDEDRIRRIFSAAKEFMQNPDVNKSGYTYAVKDNKIIVPLTFVKQVGIKALQSIVTERNKNGAFLSIDDFCKRLPPKTVPKNIILQLIWAGCFNSLHSGLQQKDIIKLFYEYRASTATKGEAAKLWAEYNSQFANLNRVDQLVRAAQVLPVMADDLHGTINDCMGGGLRLNAFKDILEAGDSSKVRTAGILMDVKFAKTKKGDDYARLELQNGGMSLPCLIWPKELRTHYELLAPHSLVLIDGKVNRWNKNLSVIISSMRGVALALKEKQ